MIQQQAKSVKDLAKPMVEALKVITETACIVCNGTGRFPYIADLGKDPCSRCHGTGKVWWKWEPKVGEWFMCGCNGELTLLPQETDYVRWICKDKTLKIQRNDGQHLVSEHSYPLVKCIPILLWEEIERVLEGWGYWLEVDKPLNKYIKKGWMKVRARIYEDIAKNAAGNGEYVSCAEGKSRQEAVMKAVIKLGEEMNAKSR